MSKYKKIIILVLLAAIASALAWRYLGVSDNSNVDEARPTNTVNYDSPTKTEQNAGEEAKDQIVKSQSENTPQINNHNASITVTDAAQYDDVIEVRSFISDIYKDGTCTFIFTKGNLRLSKETAANRDATTTICNNPLVARSEFPSTGNWQVTVSYQSTDSTSIGRSATHNITIK